MRLAISNIAWDISQDEQIAALLRHYDLDAIDIAPGKYFPEPSKAQDADIFRVRQWWESRGIEITGMQALLFGTKGLNLFGKPDVQIAMLQHLKEVCRIASGLGATRLVFGSPKNRDRSGLTDEQTNTVAYDFFLRLGAIADSHGVVICLEPNPSCYGCNFMTGSMEAAMFVEQLCHPAIRLQLDTGTITVNNEDPATVIEAYAQCIGHIHASEPNLVPLGNGGADHAKLGKLIAKNLSSLVVTIEMLTTSDGARIDDIERAIKFTIPNYQ